jgi:hypothetical protein
MSLEDWFHSFKELHEKARRGTLAPGENATYSAARDELARAMLAAQRLTLRPGETARRALRVARALQVDLDLGTSAERSVTLDVSAGGFSTQLAATPTVGDEAKVTLRLPGNVEFRCQARITGVRPQLGSVRVSAQFLGLSDAEREQLELVVLDAVLAQLEGHAK